RGPKLASRPKAHSETDCHPHQSWEQKGIIMRGAGQQACGARPQRGLLGGKLDGRLSYRTLDYRCSREPISRPQRIPVRRREFITLLGGIAVAWPLPTCAQQPERMRRIGILWPYTEADPDSQSRIASLRQALVDLGWIEGRNLRLDYRWGASADSSDRIRRYAMELVALAPDVIVAGSGGIA